MSEKPSKAEQTQVDLKSAAGTATLAGPGWVIITIIALLGMILLAWKCLDLANKAVEQQRPNASQVPGLTLTPPFD